jgi:ribosome biogenesis GTPase / thiamine phosphate phosphatase
VNRIAGTVLGREGASYRVLTAAGEVQAVLRGKVKRDSPKVVVGDRVGLDPHPGEAGIYGIGQVEPRKSVLGRRVPGGRGTRPVAANIDEVLVVTATARPDPVPQLIDRLLVVAAANDLPAALALNKIDLDAGDALATRFERAGYPVYRISVWNGTGLESLLGHLTGRETVVTGPSGAGKSSLLNALEPGLALRTGAISEKVGRGKQTTVAGVMVPLAAGGFIVDTPGLSEVGLWGIAPRDLAPCFPEFRSLVDHCRFADCSHTHEPGCAIAGAVQDGAVQADRWESYRVLFKELEELPEEWE